MVRGYSHPEERASVLLLAPSSVQFSCLPAIIDELGADLVRVATCAEGVNLCSRRTFAAVLLATECDGGCEALRELRRAGIDRVPLLVIAPAEVSETLALVAYGEGATDVLPSPLCPITLKAKLGTFIRLYRELPHSPHGVDPTRSHRDVLRSHRIRHEFLAMLGHELRNPLAPLGNAVQILRQTGTKGPLADQTLDLIDRQLRHLTRLVEDLLDVSRITRGIFALKKETLDLNEALTRASELVRPLVLERSLHLNVELASQPLPVLADPARLDQILDNLLNNAIRYTEPGGHIWLSAAAADKEAVLRVRDTGVGIRPEMQPFIFDLFTQADRAPDRPQEGLGIGLTLVHRLVELHGGCVAVSSPGLGQGSEFTVHLPLQTTALEASRPKPRYLAPSPRLLRILVIEDNRDTAKSLANVLRLWGHEVEIAYDGPGGLETAQHSHPEVIFLDIGLPMGMDGYEVALRLREQPGLEKVVLIALTGFGQPEDRRRALAAGFDLHVTKPIQADDLRKLLVEVCTHAATGGNVVSP